MSRPRFGFEVTFGAAPPVAVIAVDKRAAEVRAAMELYPNGNMTSWMAAQADKVVKIKTSRGRIVR